MDNKRLEMANETAENIDVVAYFDDCDSGFLAKNEKLLTWLLS